VLQWARKLVGAPAAEVRSLAELEAAGGGRLTMVGAFAAYAGEAYEAYMKREWRVGRGREQRRRAGSRKERHAWMVARRAGGGGGGAAALFF
jgi:hypothetical protein